LTLKGSPQGTLLVYGDPNRVGGRTRLESLKSLLAEPGTAVPEECALSKKRFANLVAEIATGDDGKRWQKLNWKTLKITLSISAPCIRTREWQPFRKHTWNSSLHGEGSRFLGEGYGSALVTVRGGCCIRRSSQTRCRVYGRSVRNFQIMAPNHGEDAFLVRPGDS
jgi:hypothetical protein